MTGLAWCALTTAIAAAAILLQRRLARRAQRQRQARYAREQAAWRQLLADHPELTSQDD